MVDTLSRATNAAKFKLCAQRLNLVRESRRKPLGCLPVQFQESVQFGFGYDGDTRRNFRHGVTMVDLRKERRFREALARACGKQRQHDRPNANAAGVALAAVGG